MTSLVIRMKASLGKINLGSLDEVLSTIIQLITSDFPRSSPKLILIEFNS